MKFKRKYFVIVGVIIVVALILRATVFKKEEELESYEVKKGSVEESIILSGAVNADEYASLRFPASGKISWVGVTEGDSVVKGQALTKIDTRNLNSDFERAKADLRDAEATVDKVHDDVKDSDADETLTERETRTAAEVAKDKAYEAYKKALENLQNATILSPFAGIVTLVSNPFVGLNVLLSETQIEVVNPETIFFEVSADQEEVASLYTGQDVVVVFDSLPDKEVKGKISFIGFTPKSNELGTVYKIKVSFNNLGELTNIRIGMTGDSRFVLSKKEDVIYIPSDFLNSDKKNGKHVLLKGEKVRKVEVGIEGEEVVEITDGLEEGDIIFD